jgi:hypothetical protein
MGRQRELVKPHHIGLSKGKRGTIDQGNTYKKRCISRKNKVSGGVPYLNNLQ